MEEATQDYWASSLESVLDFRSAMDDFPSGVVKCGGYRYEDGTRFIGDWNKKGQKHGLGHYLLSDGTRYDGSFSNGLCSGLGVLKFADGAK